MIVSEEHQKATTELPGPEALIEEARRRQRKRRLLIGMVAIAVAVGSGIWVASNGGTGYKPPSSLKRPSHVKSPAGAPGSAKKGTTPASIAFDGKYAISTVAFPTASEGFVLMGGYPDNKGSGVAWLERTTNGGRTWSLQPQPNFLLSSLAFNSAAYGWAYGPSLLKTTDAGRTWQRVHTEGSVFSVVPAGRYTWFAEQTAPHRASLNDCRTLLLRSTHLGANPTPVTVQPPIGSSCSVQFVDPTPLSAYAMVQQRSGAFRLVATDNGGDSWAVRAVPCTGQLTFGGSKSSLWLICPYGQPIFGDVHRTRTFQSTDGGRTWSKNQSSQGGIGTEGGPGTDGWSTVQSSPLVYWSWTELLYGRAPGEVQRTVDGGRHWRTIFPNGAIHAVPALGPISLMVPQGLVVHSASSASLVVEVYGRSVGNSVPTHFLLGATRNDGKTWSWSYLVNERTGSGQRSS